MKFSLSNFSFSGDRQKLADGAWPRAAIVTSLEQRYEEVGHLGDDTGISFYGVSDRGVRFVAALVHADGSDQAIVEVGFLARFTGYSLSDQAMQGVNGNLHVSVVVLDGEGDLYLIGGVQAADAYDDATFALILEAWRRDMMIVIQAVSGGSMMEAFPAARYAAARKFAENAAPVIRGADPAGETAASMAEAKTGQGAPNVDASPAIDPASPVNSARQTVSAKPAVDYAAATQMFSRFMGADGPAKALCATCGGRGKTGFIARSCFDCDGSGFTRVKTN